jgi:hypothetical protein
MLRQQTPEWATAAKSAELPFKQVAAKDRSADEAAIGRIVNQ